MMGEIGSMVAAVLCAVAFGSMVFFAAVVAPLVFMRLPEDVSGPFIRQVFPVYYLTLAVVTGAAALASLPTHPWHGLVLSCVCIGFVYARQGLMPRINRLRDREIGGDSSAAAPFQKAHRASVVLNTGQMLALLAVLVSQVGAAAGS